MAKSFSAQLKGFTEKYEGHLLDIFREASQDLFARAQTAQAGVGSTGGRFERGKIPVDTGFLRNSGVTALNGSVTGAGADSYVLSLAQSKLGDTVFFGWTAEYAPHIEYGTENIEPRAYVRDNAIKWKQIVARAAAMYSA